jgi:hypothetical protein
MNTLPPIRVKGISPEPGSVLYTHQDMTMSETDRE